MVGQYGEIFSSWDYVLSLPPVGASLELNISPYCPPIIIIIMIMFLFFLLAPSESATDDTILNYDGKNTTF